jgi:ABC-type phosphate/phosphonate transport system substrate-binding protein
MALFDTAPDKFQVTKILSLTDQIPNDVIAIGADMPLMLVRQIMTSTQEYVSSAGCERSLCAPDFFAWEGIEPAAESDFDSLRERVSQMILSDIDFLPTEA